MNKTQTQWEGVKLIRDKKGNVIRKDIYNYKTGKLLYQKKVSYPILKINNLKKIIKDSKIKF